MPKKLLIHAWSVQKRNNEYYLPYTHWIYLNEIIKYYNNIVLLSPCQLLDNNEETSAMSLSELPNVIIYELPYSKSGYVGAIKYFFKYVKAYRSIKDITTYYSRYPTPFGWLQRLYGKGVRRIIHYVGDPISATINNPNFSKSKKNILTSLFKPEDYMYDWACRGAEIFTNGHHIAEKLKKKDIKATPLVSSTLTQNDFFFDDNKPFFEYKIRLLYVGYLRKAKGIETVLRAFKLILKDKKDSILTIVGSGEFERELKEIVELENISNVTFLGHIENREKLNQLFRSHDVFVFASLSEGSPRVVLEAMSNGLAVVSTPVGSLPYTFIDNEEIMFAQFNDINGFKDKVLELYANDTMNRVRKKSFIKVENYTIDKFLKTIFYEK